MNATNTFDDDYEPVRPSMTAQGPEPADEGYGHNQYENFEETQSYEGNATGPLQGSRQSSSIGIVNRSTRMVAQQNYRVSQGQSRKGNARSIYDNNEIPTGMPVPQRGTTTERGSRSGAKHAIAL